MPTTPAPSLRTTAAPLLGLALVAGFAAWIGPGRARPATAIPAAPGPPELELPVPPRAWPLGLDGFQPRRLYATHGQFQQFDTCSSPPCTRYTHQGLDIAACPGEYVYAIEAGQVVKVVDDTEQSNKVVIASEADPTHGYLYMHLDKVLVEEDDPVVRDQALGTIVAWNDSCGYDHLHLQRVFEDEDYGWPEYADAANPLPGFPARADDQGPTIVTGSDGPFTFHKPGAEDTAVEAKDLAGDVVVVAVVRELFDGTGAIACEPPACLCPDPSTEVAPLRLTLTISRPEPVPDASTLSDPRSTWKPVYVNTIDLSGANTLTSTLAKRIYHEDSVGDYTSRSLRFRLTGRTDVDVSAPWTVGEDGPYRLELLVEDASGNVAVAIADIEVGGP